MKTHRKEIRALISRSGRKSATAWVKSFQLRTEEESAIIMCDIEAETETAASLKLICTPETVSRYRAKGYDRISQELDGKIPLDIPKDL